MSHGRAIIIVSDDMKEGEENAPSKMIFRMYKVAGIVFQNVGYCGLYCELCAVCGCSHKTTVCANATMKLEK